MTEKYTPNRDDYIRVQGNKQYLPVPNRVQWFRGEHPDWTIQTGVVELDWNAGYAIMRAEVIDDSGRLIASGIKTETRKGFGDFVEKAETGAVGRALARAGYGTEDALDLEGDRYADAPIEQPEQRRGAKASSPNAAAPVQNQYRRGELAQLMKAHRLTVDGVEAIADRLNITERPMSDESMDRLIEAIEQPGESAPSPADIEEAGSSVPASSSTPLPEGSTAAATGAVPATPSGAASGTPSMDDILAATGGELIPPKPGSKAYRELPSGTDRANAKAYWDRKPEPEQESLAAALGGPES